jgi:hypothetical protein
MNLDPPDLPFALEAGKDSEEESGSGSGSGSGSEGSDEESDDGSFGAMDGDAMVE